MAQNDEPIGTDAFETMKHVRMKKAFSFALALILESTSILLAQPSPSPSPTPRPVLPPGPPLAKAPEFAQWTVVSRSVISDPAVSPSPGVAPVANQTAPAASPARKATVLPVDQQVVVTKTRNIRHEQLTTVGGSKTEKWCVPDMQVTVNGSGNPVVALPGSAQAGSYVDYSKTDFGGFEWISAQNFEGIEKVMGQDCLVFRDIMKFTADNARSGPPPKVVAWINADSHLPVALQLGEETRTYQFDAAPPAMLDLPPKIDALTKQWRKMLRQASLPAAKP